MDATWNNPIRIVLVDGEPLFRAGVDRTLGWELHCEIVGEAGTIREGFAEIERHRPDVALVDNRFPDGDGKAFCERVCKEFPEVRVLVLSRVTSSQLVLETLKAGVAGYIVKSSPPELLRLAVETVAKGETYLDSKVAGGVAVQANESQRSRNKYGLTRQEVRCLKFVLRGCSNPEIGDLLSIGVETVKTHIKHAMRKTGTDDRHSAAKVAEELGLFDIDDWLL